MRRKTKRANKNKPQVAYNEADVQQYLSELDTPSKATEIVIVVEPTLADIDPYAHEQFEQEMRDAQFDKESSWVARLIHFGIRKRKPG